MANQDLRAANRIARITGLVALRPVKLRPAARDEQSVERESAAAAHCHGERIGQIRLPIQHADDRPGTVGRAQLQRLIRV